MIKGLDLNYCFPEEIEKKLFALCCFYSDVEENTMSFYIYKDLWSQPIFRIRVIPSTYMAE